MKTINYMVSIIRFYLLAIYNSGQQLLVILDIILQYFVRSSGTVLARLIEDNYFMSHSTKMTIKIVRYS